MSEGGGEDVRGGGGDDGVDDFSDASDDSDMFHVAAKVVGEPRAGEGPEMAIVDCTVPHLWGRPLRRSSMCSGTRRPEMAWA